MTRHQFLGTQLALQAANITKLPPSSCFAGMQLEFYFDKLGIPSIRINVVEEPSGPIVDGSVRLLREQLSLGFTIHELAMENFNNGEYNASSI